MKPDRESEVALESSAITEHDLSPATPVLLHYFLFYPK